LLLIFFRVPGNKRKQLNHFSLFKFSSQWRGLHAFLLDFFTGSKGLALLVQKYLLYWYDFVFTAASE